MNEARPPVEPPDALEEAYRKASAADAGAPSEAIRQRILAHARTVAESRRPAAKFPVETPAANDRYWWRGIAASLAVAAIAVALWLPRERREAALQPAPQALTRVAPSLEGKTGAPAATPESQAPRDVAPREAQRFAEEPRLEARLRAPPPQAPVGGAIEAQAGKPSRAPAAPPAVQGSAPATDQFASRQRALADLAAAPAVSPAAAPASPAAAAPSAAAKAERPAIQDVVVTEARKPTAGEVQSTPITALNSGLASRAQATLATAITAGDVPGVRALVPRRIGLENRDALGRTPLMQAVIAGQPEIVRYLIDAGADVDAADADRATPLARARAAGRSDLTRLLEAAGAH